MPRPLLILLVATVTCATALPAYAQWYARTGPDTLTYDETTRVQVGVDTPQGSFQIEVSHDARLGLAYATEDTLRGWYESLVVSSESPMGNQTPSTQEVIGVPFTLLASERGEIRTLETPEVPAGLRGSSDIRRQFDDFFLILPEEPLAPGYSWDYEVSLNDSTDARTQHAFRKAGRLTVVGDTVVAGARGWKITGDLNSTLTASQYVPEQGAVVRNAFSGVESNTFVFSPEEGVMTFRRRNANLSGETTIEGGAMPMTMGQQIRYQSTLELQD